MGWDTKDIALLKSLWSAGQSAAQIARRLGAPCDDALDPAALSEHERLLFEIFEAADVSWRRHLLRRLSDPTSFRIFWR